MIRAQFCFALEAEAVTVNLLSSSIHAADKVRQASP
jgi:hypothetical protein